MPQDTENAQEAIRLFLATAKEPAIVEPGELPLPLLPDTFTLELAADVLTLHAWDRERNLVRRVKSVAAASGGGLRADVEKFGKKPGSLDFIDLRKPSAVAITQRAGRSVGRERLRRSLSRQFPGWSVSEISADADLQHSLSPAFPRALVKKGSTGWAAILSPEGQAEPDRVLTFGLIWLTYLRQRERRLQIAGLVLFLPDGQHQNTCLRLLHLRADSTEFRVVVYGDHFEEVVDLRNHGNAHTELPPRPPAAEYPHWMRPVTTEPGVDVIARPGGSVRWRVNGLEFAEWDGQEVRYGLARKWKGGAGAVTEIRAIARELMHARSAGSGDRASALYLRNPEAWLESRIRLDIATISADLRSDPVYGQIPATLVRERGVLDLLACDYNGRLAVVEVKVEEDVDLPLQALDYWIRVKWHVDHGTFAERGFFEGITLQKATPRMLLVSPVLNLHPTTEQILQYFTEDIEVEQIGVAMDWRRELKVLFRRNKYADPRP